MINTSLILASASPRRIEMFQKHGFDPIIMPSDIHENLPEEIDPEIAVMFLALKKGLETEFRILEENKIHDSYIIAADTIVYKDKILGKPQNEEDAFQTLTMLKNTSHQVITGVCIIQAGMNHKLVFYETTHVEMSDYSQEEIREYINTGEPMDKAGAYAIQGKWGIHVASYHGDYDNIVGFPWSRFEKEFLNFQL